MDLSWPDDCIIPAILELTIAQFYNCFGCYLFFEEGTREGITEVTREEVHGLYWY